VSVASATPSADHLYVTVESRQPIIAPAHHQLIFTGRMLFLSCRSTKSSESVDY